MARKIPNRSRGIQRLFESGIKGVLFVCALVSVITLVLVFLFLLRDSLPFWGEVPILEFLTGTRWAPHSANPSWGVLPLLVGTLLVSFVGALIAVPIGIGCTIYLSEIASPSIKKVLKPAIELLAGVPSVVYGLFAALVLSNLIMDLFHPLTRLNALNGAIILAVMMVPIQISISEEAMNAVPRNIREASYALGATKWETIRRVIFPSALPGIIAAIALAIGRAVGETMAVLMATGNSTQFTFDILSSVRTMTAALAIEIPESAVGSLQYSGLFAVGLLLFLITFVINLIADFVLTRYREAYR
ncbi:phosphate ABC transporter permease subunit PstC [Methanomassiliicoccus luminyensis]|uniref:phosphate ABC transporter permease subunit PstC n=1 Tax=Methanomassiliicoccus luminyensis TaxID=1080712 RepID=UPI0003821C2B|nr:phosphate ABC transporter permease subunit PstC [Methanomassiliicoccus luminyensis]